MTGVRSFVMAGKKIGVSGARTMHLVDEAVPNAQWSVMAADVQKMAISRP